MVCTCDQKRRSSVKRAWTEQVVGRRSRGRQRIRWRDVVKRDMRERGLWKEDVFDRNYWRRDVRAADSQVMGKGKKEDDYQSEYG